MKKIFVFGVLVAVAILGLCAKGNAEVPKDGLVAEYLFENNASDTSGNNNNGTGNGVTYISGKFGKAAAFDGDDYIQFDSPIISPSLYSISVWVKYPNVLSRHQYILSNGGETGSSQGVTLCIIGKNSSGYPEYVDLGTSLIFGFKDYEAISLSASLNAPLMPEQWHHVVAAWDSSFGSEHPEKTIYYIDGKKYTSVFGINTTQRYGPQNNMCFGLASNSSGSNLQGTLDNV